MCATLHSSQAMKPLILKRPICDDGALAPDGGERAEVAIAERRRPALPFCARDQQIGDVLALLLGDRRDAGQRLAVCASIASAVSPMTKMSGWPGTERSGVTFTRPARSVSAPSQWPAGEAITPAAQMTVRASMRSAPIETPSASSAVTAVPSRTSTPSCSSDVFAASDSDGIERRQQARRRLDQNDARAARIDRAEIRRERAVGKLRDGAGHLDAGRAAADDDEIQQPRALGRIGLGLGLLEGEQDAAADVGRVVDGLQAGRERRPVVVAEIGVLRAGRENQVS